MKKILSVFILLIAIFSVTSFLLSSCSDEEDAIYEAVLTHHYGDSAWHVGKVLSISGSDEYANALSPGKLFEFRTKNYNGERLNEGDTITFTNVSLVKYDGVIIPEMERRYKVEIIYINRINGQ